MIIFWSYLNEFWPVGGALCHNFMKNIVQTLVICFVAWVHQIGVELHCKVRVLFLHNLSSSCFSHNMSFGPLVCMLCASIFMRMLCGLMWWEFHIVGQSDWCVIVFQGKSMCSWHITSLHHVCYISMSFCLLVMLFVSISVRMLFLTHFISVLLHGLIRLVLNYIIKLKILITSSLLVNFLTFFLIPIYIVLAMFSIDLLSKQQSLMWHFGHKKLAL